MDIPLDIIGTKACTEKHISRCYPEFYEFLGNKYPGIPFGEQIYLYSHSLDHPPVCPVCGGKVSLINGVKGYHEYCSIKCSRNSEATMSKLKETKKERYGDENYNNRNKARETCLERYGVGMALQSGSIREKSKNTKKERYGDENYNNSSKSRITKKERYGDENYNNSSKSRITKKERYGDENYNNRNKARETCQERYGADNPFQADGVKEKSRNTMKERYGVEYTRQSPELDQKCKATLLKRYGVDHQSKSLTIKTKIVKANRNRIIYSHPFLIGYTDIGDWKCMCPHPNACDNRDKCDGWYSINPKNYFARKEYGIEPCTLLRPISPVTNKDTSLEKFITNILGVNDIPYTQNDRTVLDDKELDVYIPSKNLAIECNGIFFHSASIKPSDYHVNKWRECKKKGIQLLTFWEDQIINTPVIVESVLLSKLGIYKEKIGARKCTVIKLDSHTCAEFLNKNHIQGSTKPTVRLGLMNEGRLVSVMTFSKKSKLSGTNKNSSEGVWELSRFCNLLNITVIGGFSKLLHYFIERYNPKVIESFASNDISNGGIYRNNGFEEVGDTSLAYWYIHKYTLVRYHRTSFTKSRLCKLGYDVENKTESEIMESLPYNKIYDSGHTKYVLSV